MKLSLTLRLPSRLFAIGLIAVAVSTLGCNCSCNTAADGYFDAHSHNNGILPYYAYADLDAFIKHPGDPTEIGLWNRRQLWSYVASSQAPSNPPDPRIMPGALATLKAYGQKNQELTPQQVNGALERVLTTTPWTEFDSAYAVRGDPLYSYLDAYFDKKLAQRDQAICAAELAELAATKTAHSEQFLSFIGGWKFRNVVGHPGSDRLDVIRCFEQRPKTIAGKPAATKAQDVKVLLMTHTSELGEAPAGTPDGATSWMQYNSDPDGACKLMPDPKVKGKFAPPLKTDPKIITNALLGQDDMGNDILEPGESPSFFEHVIGIDTAGPEITCFTAPGALDSPGLGMQNYTALVQAVYDAAIARRAKGWHGKLLVHTHVGEGGAVYQWNSSNPRPGAATDPLLPFESFPPIKLNSEGVPVHVIQARKNIQMLLNAVDKIKSDGTHFKDVDNYLVFRFGHVTQANDDNAKEMKRLGIEADINLESNIATRAYYTARLAKPVAEPLNEAMQLEFDDLPGEVLRSGHAAEILSGHSLQFMLKEGVRTLLGSDGGGEEHSDIGREYKLGADLINYWKSQGIMFPAGVTGDIFRKNAEEHLRDLGSDTKLQ